MEILLVFVGLAILIGLAWLVDKKDKAYYDWDYLDDEEL